MSGTLKNGAQPELVVSNHLKRARRDAGSNPDTVSFTGGSKLSRYAIPVEYWISSAGVWTESAQLSLSKTKNKLYIDIQQHKDIKKENRCVKLLA